MRRARRSDGQRARAGSDEPIELGEAIESSDALRLRMVMWLARSHGRTARARPAAPAPMTPAPEVELPPTARRRRRPRS